MVLRNADRFHFCEAIAICSESSVTRSLGWIFPSQGPEVCEGPKPVRQDSAFYPVFRVRSETNRFPEKEEIGIHGSIIVIKYLVENRLVTKCQGLRPNHHHIPYPDPILAYLRVAKAQG